MSTDYNPPLFIFLVVETWTISAVLATLVVLFWHNRDSIYIKHRMPVLDAYAATWSVTFAFMEGVNIIRRLLYPDYSIDCITQNIVNSIQIITVFAVAHRRLVWLACTMISQLVVALTPFLPTTPNGRLPQQSSIADGELREKLMGTIWYRFHPYVDHWIVLLCHGLLWLVLTVINIAIIVSGPPNQLVNDLGLAVQCKGSSFVIITILIYLIMIIFIWWDALRKVSEDAWKIFMEYKIEAILVVIVLLIFISTALLSDERMLKGHLYYYTSMVTNLLSIIAAGVSMSIPLVYTGWKRIRIPFCRKQRGGDSRVSPYQETATATSGNNIHHRVTTISVGNINIRQLTDTKEKETNFKRYLASEFSGENYQFWREADDYFNQWNTWNNGLVVDTADDGITPSIECPSAIVDDALNVYKKYIVKNAPLWVNLSDRNTEAIQGLLVPLLNREPGHVYMTTAANLTHLVLVFESAKKEIDRLVCGDTVRRYRVSSIYHELG